MTDASSNRVCFECGVEDGHYWSCSRRPDPMHAIPNREAETPSFANQARVFADIPPDVAERQRHATRNRVEIAAEFIWEAYYRGDYPGQPIWADVSEVQKRKCRFDAEGLLEKVDA